MRSAGARLAARAAVVRIDREVVTGTGARPGVRPAKVLARRANAALFEQISVARHFLLQPPQFFASVLCRRSAGGSAHGERGDILVATWHAAPADTAARGWTRQSARAAVVRVRQQVRTEVRRGHDAAGPAEVAAPPPPSTTAPTQACWLVGHVQALSTHVAPVGQVSPQLPQLFGSLVVWTHVPASPEPQKCSMPAHMHVPPWHGAPPGHTVPHPPQFFLSLIGSMQTPVAHRSRTGVRRVRARFSIFRPVARPGPRTPLRGRSRRRVYLSDVGFERLKVPNIRAADNTSQ